MEDNSVYPLCVEAAKGIPVIANGGIGSVEGVEALMGMGVAGVMIGRSALGNPAVFDVLRNGLGLNDPVRGVPSLDELRQEYDGIYEALGGSGDYRGRFLGVMAGNRPRY